MGFHKQNVDLKFPFKYICHRHICPLKLVPLYVCGGQEDVRGVNKGGNGGNIFLLATSTVRPFKQAGGKVAISFEHPDRKTFGDEDVQESSSSLIYIKKSFPTKKAVEDI